VIVVLQKQLELKALNKSLSTSLMTRQARHEQVIESLRVTAHATQGSVLNYLQRQKALGKVQDYQSFWIVNAVALTATTKVIEEIAQHPEVAAVYKDKDIGPIEPIKPIEFKKVFDRKTGVEPGLKAIKADYLWAKGINGAGTLVCSIDTGVDGNHIALFNRWRGNNGATAQESWFDPHKSSSFPVDDLENHGTLTMGVMTGMSAGDTIGAAFGAQWITANFFENDYIFDFVALKTILACFQWIADPDGNPATIEDVPDVLNGSFYVGGWRVCTDILWDAIDAVEAAGVVAIFSAGNDGENGALTLVNQASRATTPINTFSVGAVDANNLIAAFSSRGPSRCDSTSVKPEVVAPGVQIRSSVVDGYGVASGTSSSAPHVSGAVALLRQNNPDATVEEIKYALLNSAMDLGAEGEDNSYGTGIIDIDAAAQLLPPNIRPNINISRFTLNGEHTHFVQKGRTTEMVVYLINTGIMAQNVSARLVASDPYCQISEPWFDFGTIRQNEMLSNAPRPFGITVKEAAPPGHNIVFNLEITADNGAYMKINRFSALVNKRAPRISVEPLNLEFNLERGEQAWSVVTLANPGSDNLEYEVSEVQAQNTLSNFSRNEKRENRAEARAFWGTSDSNTLLTVIRDSVGDMPRAHNFDIAQLRIALVDTFVTFQRYIEPTEHVISGHFSSLWIETVLDSGNTFLLNSSFIIFLDTDQNISTGAYPTPRPGTPSSKHSLLDIGAEFEAFGFISNNPSFLIWKYTSDGKFDPNWGAAQVPLGIKSNKVSVVIPFVLFDDENNDMNIAVSGDLSVVDTTDIDGGFIYLDLVPDVGHGLIGIDNTPIPWLTEVPRKGVVSPRSSSKDIYLVADATHLENFIYTSNVFISTNDPDQPLITIPVKVTVGNSKRPVIPEQFQLYQNYPNPFNSSTNIEYQLSEVGRVTIEVFNALGQKVKTLVDADKTVGYHRVVWDGKNSLGKDAASGVYLYRMKIKNLVERKKLVLIR
jgi:subtilisin family serine protease